MLDHPLADRWTLLLGKLPDLKLRANLLRAELVQRDPALVAEGLRALIDAWCVAGIDAAHVLGALVCAFADPACDDARQRIAERASGAEFTAARTVLGFSHSAPRATTGTGPPGSGRPAPEPDRASPERAPAGEPAGRPLTLGERKSLARTHDRKLLDRACRDAHPAVIAILLDNPSLTEDRVVRIVARRPQSEVALRLVAAHATWCARARVRSALAHHPSTPPYLAAPLLCLLGRAALREVASTPLGPPHLRQVATYLLNLPPPVPLSRAAP